MLVLLAGATACGRAHLFYETRELRHDPIGSNQKDSLVHTVSSALGDRSLTWVDPEGREQAVTPDEAGLSRLPLDVLGAIWLATATGDAGGEADVRVHLRGSRATVSVYIDLDGSVVAVSPRAGASRPETPLLSKTEIRRRFLLKGDMTGTWKEPERRALTEALSLLPPEVLRAVKTVRFDNRTKHKSGDLTRAALFEQRGCRSVIYLYATGVESDRFRFIGDPSAPRSAVMHSLLHEIGHAFEQAGSRERHCRAEKARGNERDRLVREGNRFLRESPILSAYLHALDGMPAPTDYGQSSPHESFAESFALFYTDPDALKRARPAVYEWFARGGHLEFQ